MTEESASSGMLAGIRVLDFGRYIAGPYCAALLADLGAEVIRIERPVGGDDRYILPVAENGDGALYLQINRNKRSLTLSPAKPEGREVVRRLAASADVVVANVPFEGLKAMGLDYESLKAIRSDIILSSQSAFGDTGPYASRPGFDGIAQAMSGATYMSGTGDQPLKSYASWCDFSTGLAAGYGTLAALLHRFRTGEGQVVKANLLRTALNIFHFNNLEAYLLDRDRPRSGNRSQFGAPGDLFKTRDGWIQTQVIGQTLFERWCRLVGKEELVDEERFQSDNDRAENAQVLNAHMQTWVAEFTSNEALQMLENARIPAGPMLSPMETLCDPHVRATDMLSWIDYPGLGKSAPLVNGPVEFSTFSANIRRPPPTLGQDTAEILSGLGYTSGEIASLRDLKVV